MLTLPLDVPPARLTDGFGARESFSAGVYKTSLTHGGQDLAPPIPGQEGYPCEAVGHGRVVAIRLAGRNQNVWGNRAIYNEHAGNYVLTEHASSTPLLYAYGVWHTRIWVGLSHLAAVRVKPGDVVTASSQVGIVGETGAAVGEHVHVDVFVDFPSLGSFAFSRRVDPMRVLGKQPKVPVGDLSKTSALIEGDTMRVIANVETDSWAFVGAGFYGIPGGEGQAFLTLCGQSSPIRVSAAEFAAIGRAYGRK